jgi:hypothetical protein
MSLFYRNSLSPEAFHLILIRLPNLLLPWISNPQNRLPNVFPLQHLHKPLSRILNTLRKVEFRLQAPVQNPLRNLLVPLLRMLRNVLVENEEAFPSQALPHQLPRILDAVAFAGLVVVL